MRYQFAEYVLDPGRRELYQGGTRIGLEPQVFDLLVYLVSNRDRVVSKDALMKDVWGGRIVSDAAIDSRVKAARQVISDSGAAQRFIRTMPRKGLRFVADVREENDPSGAPQAATVSDRQSPPAFSDKASIAVLPFANLSSDTEQEYFSDGMVDDLTTALSRFRTLFVVARNSSFVYKNRAADVREIGNALGARYVLSGSLRKIGRRMRLTVQLTDAVAGNQIWAERYDRDITDVFELQDDITSVVTAAVLPALGEAERTRAMRRPPQDLGAWEAYQRGVWLLEHGAGADNEQARAFFQQAISRDATLACACSGLAYTYCRDVVSHRKSPAEAFAEAEPLARAAVNLDGLDAIAHAILSMTLLYMRGAYDEAAAAARRSLELSPNLGLAHSTMGQVLLYSGDARAGLGPILAGQRLDPRNPLINHYVHAGHARYFCRDYAGALEMANLSLGSWKGYRPMYFFLAAALGQLGRTADARAALDQAVALGVCPFGLSADGERLPWIRPEDGAHLLEGLRKAGWKE